MRRPLNAIAHAFVKTKFSANDVALFSLIFGSLAGLAFVKAYSNSTGVVSYPWLLLAAVSIQIRFLPSMINQLIVEETGKKISNTILFSEIPDRLADVAMILGAGYFAAHFWPGSLYLAWAASVFAVLTSYVRVLGCALTGKYDYAGPMAKRHRMWVLTIAALGTLIEWGWDLPYYSLFIALAVIALGGLITVAHRLLRLNDALNSRS